ncbi:putative monovalent cation/H+ antiporter subunit A [Jannaschia seohaensis]|uniref:Multicomponent Na+:H+ antiporter subunit A n=1 Tax=Jannaschia seohaensis TaxID=475081 RepID=A0A2Y9BAA4_9RHOB|nr:putative monovalent cation/H+ antiporter subunit A [Jannaschia seohaensis]PWJ12076.1 multicomponent Na+:H+ antiporter subunit A [Jannaschia seohaensis]SSA51179.1 multicomponent Na+:H+ antiporter subunit A [Jannaschia seohaensis]
MGQSESSGKPLGGSAGIISILVPGGLFVWFLQFLPAVAAGETILFRYDWVPALGVSIGMLIDGLSLSFALLITGIGTLVTLYSSSYLGGHVHYSRFVCYLLSFMLGMLGLVLSDNLLALFVFWEVTTIASYLLIGFSADESKSRRNALQALLVTGTGGLAFLAGIILLGAATGTFELSEIEGSLAEHPLYLPIFILVVLGAFTKSAQVPFHFWLPNAMAAPTPVSAYLHSATMVKGGVYLLARLNPSLGGTDLWFWTLTLFGGVTAVFASILAIKQIDIKQVLAYTTLMALGTLVMFIGLGTSDAIKAAMVFLLVHSFYKASLFLMIGVVDHGTGTRDATVLRGLTRAMPFTALAAALAALSMAGIPPLFGFIGKEFFYKASLSAEIGMFWVTACAFLASALMFAAAGIVAWRPFTGRLAETPVTPHEGPWAMLIGPLLLAALGLGLGLFPDYAEVLVRPATAAVYGAAVEVDLYLFKEVNSALILSLVTFALGWLIYMGHGTLRDRLRRSPDRFDPGWDRLMDGVLAGCKWQANLIQTGQLRRYIFVTFLTLAVALVWTIWRAGLVPTMELGDDLRVKHWAVLIAITAGAAIVAFTNSRMTAVAALGVVGVGVALIFITFGAPDVAITQLLVEVLVVVLVAVAMLKLPQMNVEHVKAVRVWDLLLALTIGVSTTVVLLTVMDTPFDLRLTEFFEQASAPVAFGRNIVNVILVDFRALDTFGEIAVVAIAALGAYALLRGTRRPNP